MKKIFLSFFTLLFVLTANAQTKNTPFTDAQLKSFENETKELLDEYTGAVSHLIKAPENQRNIIVENIKNFFIPGAIIQVQTMKNIRDGGKPFVYSLDKYLNVVVPGYHHRFADAIVYFQKVVIDPHQLKTGTDRNGHLFYTGSFTFTQFFCVRYQGPYSSEKLSGSIKDDDAIIANSDFCEQTQKKGSFILTKKLFQGEGDVWEMRLGNILVNDIEQLKP